MNPTMCRDCRALLFVGLGICCNSYRSTLFFINVVGHIIMEMHTKQIGDATVDVQYIPT